MKAKIFDILKKRAPVYTYKIFQASFKCESSKKKKKKYSSVESSWKRKMDSLHEGRPILRQVLFSHIVYGRIHDFYTPFARGSRGRCYLVSRSSGLGSMPTSCEAIVFAMLAKQWRAWSAGHSSNHLSRTQWGVLCGKQPTLNRVITPAFGLSAPH